MQHSSSLENRWNWLSGIRGIVLIVPSC
uniref:Uncharacterized protein n=1 Tax=Anguilla anguilla TaxID=7936 RepID=A0A0E9XIV9_ANGAN